jgi:uncharacterized protein YecT (DUF1311 family)
MAWSSLLTRIGASIGAAVAGGTAWVVLEPRAEDAAEKIGLRPVEIENTAADSGHAGEGVSYGDLRPELDLTRHPDARPSFDCDKATVEMELLICADPALAEADRMMGQIYASLRERNLITPNLTFKQQAWIASRNACLIATDPKDCVRHKMLMRIDELSAL